MVTRLIAIGDVHGFYNPLQKLIDSINPRRDDMIITCGDYVDRGPAAPAVLDFLCNLKQEGILKPLRGNHDQLMLDSRLSENHTVEWLRYQGSTTLQNYGCDDVDDYIRDPEKYIPRKHFNFIDKCKDYIETPSFIFVHGGVRPEMPLAMQPREHLHWRRFSDALPHYSGKVVICGHSATPRIENRGFAICIDTQMGTTPFGWLTGLDVLSGRFWQVNRTGRARTGRIEMRNTRESTAAGARHGS